MMQSDDQSSRSQPIAVLRTVPLEDGSSAKVSAGKTGEQQSSGRLKAGTGQMPGKTRP